MRSLGANASYAINLPCDRIIVTSIRETRLYHKGSDQQTYERLDTVRMLQASPGRYATSRGPAP